MPFSNTTIHKKQSTTKNKIKELSKDKKNESLKTSEDTGTGQLTGLYGDDDNEI